MGFRLKTAALAVGATLALVAGLALPAGATTTTETVTVVADHLNNPRQIARHGNSVYVAEAGTGGDTCIDPETCFGFTGSVTKYRRGVAERVQTGLFSVGAGEGEVVASTRWPSAASSCSASRRAPVASPASHPRSRLSSARCCGSRAATT